VGVFVDIYFKLNSIGTVLGAVIGVIVGVVIALNSVSKFYEN
jgi:F0F1-type ATP synthase assembly protein I